MPWFPAAGATLTAMQALWVVIKTIYVMIIILYAVYSYLNRNNRATTDEQSLDSSNTYGFDNFINTTGKDYPISVIYGEYKHAGNRFYTEIAGNHEDNNILEICIGISEGEIEEFVSPDDNLKLNDTPWGDITSSIKSYNFYAGTTSQPSDVRLITAGISVDENAEIKPDNGYVTITGDETGTTYARIGLQCPDGLYRIDGSNYAYHYITYEIFYRAYGSGNWLRAEPNFIVNNIANVLEFTECNYCPSGGYTQYDGGNEQWIEYPASCGDKPKWEQWWQSGGGYYPSSLTKTATITNGIYTASLFAIELQNAMNAVGNSTYTVGYDNVSGIFVISSNLAGGDGKFIILRNGYQANINNNSILRFFEGNLSDGSLSTGGLIASKFKIDTDHAQSHAFGPITNRIFGKQLSTKRWEVSIKLPSANRYEYKIINTTSSRDETSYVQKLQMDYWTEQQSTGYAFPYTAYLAMTLEADEQIYGSIPNITYIVKGLKVKNWDTGATAWSDNPIWCLIDFLTNTRYGLGSFININDIDLTSAIEAADYCDNLVDDGNGGTEKRYRLDIVFDTRMDAKELIKMICNVCNMTLLYQAGKIIFKIDKPHTPVMSFNMDNIIKGSFSVQKTSWSQQKINRVLVQYQNRDNDYEREYESYDDDTEQTIRGIIERSVNGYGITRTSQARRQAMFLNNQNRTLNTSCQFKIGIKNLFATVMDNCLITHDITGWMNEEFTIVAIDEEEDEIMTVNCIVYDSSIYNLSSPSTNTPLSTTLPSPSDSTPHVNDLVLKEEIHKSISGDISTNVIASWQYPNIKDLSYLNIDGVEILMSGDGGQTYESKGYAYSPATEFTIRNVNEITDYNKLYNYSFEEDLGQWRLFASISGEGTLSQSAESPPEGNYSARIHNINILSTHPSGEAATLFLKQDGTFSITQNKLIGLKFKAKTQSGESTRNISAAIINSKNTGVRYTNTPTFGLTSSWKEYNYIFNPSQSKSGEISFAFFLGQSNQEVFLDSVRLHETGLYNIKAVAYNELYKPANIWSAPNADIVVIGKQIPPIEVANFSGGEYGNTIVLRWDNLLETEYDLAGYEIRRGITWNSGIIIDTNIVGTKYTITSYKNGTQRYWIKAIDTSGNYSLVANHIQINAVNAPITNIIYTRNELQYISDATFSNTEWVWHEVKTGDYRKCIALQTIDLYDETGDTWDSGVIYDMPIRTSGTYTTGIIDSLRLSTAQITIDIDEAYLTESGEVSINYEIRTSEDNIYWEAWRTFAEGNYTFRYFQFRIIWTGNGLNNLFIYGLTFNIDVPEFVLRGRATISDAGTGATITYISAFINLPTLSITVIGSTALIPIVTAESTTGATIKLKNLSNVDSTGTFDWTATGY